MKFLRFACGLSGIALFLSSCSYNNVDARSYRAKKTSPSLTTTSMQPQRVTFQTTDGVTIVGDWLSPPLTKNAILLVHMMPATRSSYAPLAEALSLATFSTLAIDLRGHGESTDQGGKKLNYQNFSDAEHQASRLDIDAAMNFLKGKGFHETHIFFVGASIGANLSLDGMYRYSSTPRGVLLSPGLDYRGVKTEQPMKSLSKSQKVWLIAASGDGYSADSVRALQKLNPAAATLTVFDGADHGTTLFGSQPALIQDIVKYFKDYLMRTPGGANGGL